LMLVARTEEKNGRANKKDDTFPQRQSHRRRHSKGQFAFDARRKSGQKTTSESAVTSQESD